MERGPLRLPDRIPFGPVRRVFLLCSGLGQGGKPLRRVRHPPQAQRWESAYCASSVQERICSFGSIGKKGGGDLARLES